MPGTGALRRVVSGFLRWAKSIYRAQMTSLMNRRCYATSGERIYLKVFADGHWMGEEIRSTKPVKIDVEAVGTREIERVEVMRGAEVIYRYPETLTYSGDGRIRVLWSGVMAKGRDMLARWNGSLEIDKGRIVEAEGYALESPVEKIIPRGERRIEWISYTSGDEDGVILRLDAPEDVEITFDTEIARFSTTLKELFKGPVIVEDGGVDLKVVMERLPLGIGRHVRFRFIDEEMGEGCLPYYVRVIQVDGEKVWSSPIYVDYC